MHALAHAQCTCLQLYLPAMIQAKIAGHEYNSVDPSKMLSNRMVNEQNRADGDVFEFEYLGNMHMIKLNIKTTEM